MARAPPLWTGGCTRPRLRSGRGGVEGSPSSLPLPRPLPLPLPVVLEPLLSRPLLRSRALLRLLLPSLPPLLASGGLVPFGLALYKAFARASLCACEELHSISPSLVLSTWADIQLGK